VPALLLLLKFLHWSPAPRSVTLAFTWFQARGTGRGVGRKPKQQQEGGHGDRRPVTAISRGRDPPTRRPALGAALWRAQQRRRRWRGPCRRDGPEGRTALPQPRPTGPQGMKAQVGAGKENEEFRMWNYEFRDGGDDRFRGKRAAPVRRIVVIGGEVNGLKAVLRLGGMAHGAV